MSCRVQAIWDGSLAEMLIKVQAQMQVLVAYAATAEMRDGARRRTLAAALRPLKVDPLSIHLLETPCLYRSGQRVVHAAEKWPFVRLEACHEEFHF